MAEERIVSIGFLTQRDLAQLGEAFTRHFPVTDDDMFADLIARLDEIEATPLDEGVALRPHPRMGQSS